MGGDTVAGTGKAHALLRGGLDIDPVLGDVQCLGNILHHLRNMGRQFGLLCHNGGVNVAHGPAPAQQVLPHILQQQQTGNPLILGVRVGEQLADVSGRRRTQQCVHNGMDHHIGIRMAIQSHLIGDFHTA